MSAEDKALAMKCRRAVARKECDISLMTIDCMRGVIYLTGELRRPKGPQGKNMDLHAEVTDMDQLIRRVPGVLDVDTSQLRLLE